MKAYKSHIDDKSVIEAIAFVREPAILKHFLTIERLYEDSVLDFYIQENRVTSPLLIPNQYIYRRDKLSSGDYEEYYIYYNEPDVITIANHILKNINKIKFNLEHDPAKTLTGVEFVGVCLTDEVIEANFFNLPKQTLFVQLAINNDELLQMINDKQIRGLSIEGFVGLVEDDETYTHLKVEMESRRIKELANGVFKIIDYGNK